MKTRVVRLNNMKAIRILLGKIVENLLKVFGIDPVMIFNHHLARQGFHHTIKIERIGLPLDLDQGFDPLEGDPPSGDGFQTEPAFVLRPIPNIGISF